ncbi:MAG: LuxR C-terminal-related transcriptional regulator, partial [Acidobacteriia bacterium]|nr:LuxR C-terminal-related transcriptional regulator [Terriglobia bacterium]
CRKIPLTRRQSQLVRLLAEGLKNKEIATLMTLSESTVKVYISRLFEKVGAKDRFELALFALRNLQGREAGKPQDGFAGHELRYLYLDTPEREMGAHNAAWPEHKHEVPKHGGKAEAETAGSRF